MEKRKSRLKIFIRLAISVVLLSVIATQLEPKSFLKVLHAISLESFALVSLLYLCSQILSALKWRILVGGVGIQRSLTQYIRAYVFGMFVNVFGLGTVGGDVARAVALRPQRGQRTAAFASVVADRIHGLGVLLMIGCFAILVSRPSNFPPAATYVSLAGLIGITLFWFIGPLALLKLFGAGHRFNEMALQAATAFPHKPGPFFAATGISAVFHCIQIFMFYVMAQELGANLPMSLLLATIPLVNVAATLPLSIQGIGVREGVLLWLLTPHGVSEEVVVAFGAIWLVSTTLVAALGGFILAPDLIRAGDKILAAEDPGELISLDEARKSRQSRG